MSTKTTQREHVRTWSDAKRYRLQPGEAAFRDGNPRAAYLIVGILPGDDLETVAFAEIADKTIVNPDGLDDVLEAVGDGRLGTYAATRDRLTPLPVEVWENLDADEVRR